MLANQSIEFEFSKQKNILTQTHFTKIMEARQASWFVRFHQHEHCLIKDFPVQLKLSYFTI